MSLRGRSIGLKASMSEAEMEKHLVETRKQWLSEGHLESEVINAILSKTRPLICGYYWARYPDASLRLSEVMKKLNYSVDNAFSHKLTAENNQKNDLEDDAKKSRKPANNNGDLFAQFGSLLK